MRDYGKVHTSFWSSRTIGTLSEDGRMLALYLMTSPHTTITGTFRLPDGYACEDLGWTSERVIEGFVELFRNGFANRCETTKWVWICKHLEWNPPENPNQRKSAVKVVLSIPDGCAWKPAFLSQSWPMIGIKSGDQCETVPKPFRNQKQKQEQEKEQGGKPPLSTTFVDDSESGEVDYGSTIPQCPHAEILKLFADKLPELPQPRRSLWAESKNAESLRSRWRWVMTSRHESGQRKGQRLAESSEEGVAWFGRFFEYVRTCPLLMGEKGEWHADLGWLVRKSNFEKVIQGNYESEAA